MTTIAERVAREHSVVTEDRAWFDGVLERVEREVRAEIAKEAREILSLTISAEDGRTFPTRADFAKCLDLLARLDGTDDWAFLLKERA